MPEPPVLVTGGSGVVGGAIVRRLVKEGGRPVRALARSDAAAEKVRALGAEPVRGDVAEVESLLPAVDGCEVVYHAAGVNQFCQKSSIPMRRVNVTGSANVAQAAAMAGLRRMVYTSSAVTLGEPEGTVGDEQSPHRGSFLSAYERSKYDAEQTVLGLTTVVPLQIVSVNPSSVQGPGRSSGTGQLLVAFLQGRLKYWVDTTVSLVDIDDCAEGHVLAETAGVSGQRYVLNGGSLGTTELIAVMGRIAPGLSPPRVVPKAAARMAVGASVVSSKLRGRSPEVCGESLRTLLHGHRYDGSRAARELGVAYRPVEETLRRTAEWLVESGQAPAGVLG
ncbi:MAG: NAD-dependent epimerase/dehydratase family protein [Acidimicrobiia bacterium]